MSAWSLVYDRYAPEEERLREALCVLGNGYFATRGAAPECSASEHHYPATYVAGVYNRLSTEIAGHLVENESLVNVPNWLLLRFRIEDGDWFGIDDVEVLDFRQVLEIERGILRREVRFRDAEGRETRLAQARLVHMRRVHVAALATRIVPQNWSGRISVKSGLDGTVTNSGVERYRELADRHLAPERTRIVDRHTLLLTMRTNDSGIEIAQAARTRLYKGQEPIRITPEIEERDDFVAQIFTSNVERDEPLTVEKTLVLHTSRDDAIYTPRVAACNTLASTPRFGRLRAEHVLVWSQLWRRFAFDIDFADREEEAWVARILRLHVFHLLQVCSPATMDLDAGVPARGLHGEAYRGHIFWDELFIFPLLNLRIPDITRSLMEYRYRRLGEARRAARAAGHAGAMYPWQSGSNGREESQELHLNPKSGRWIPDNSHRQRHVNSAIAWNVWHHYEVTQDVEFMAYHGAEMILDIARFWSSIAELNPARGRYEIHGVMGPDEYHDAYPGADEGGLSNNAYTNVMAVWVLGRALELEALLSDHRWQELTELLGIDDAELDRWRDITRRMFVPFHGDGIISQFEGYDRLEEFDWEGYREKYEDIQRLDRVLEAENDTPNRYKASKQADVLMLFYLLSSDELAQIFEQLGYPFEYETIPKNIEYYRCRTSHGSTLSRVVHSWVLARADREGAWRLFCDALKSDVADIQGGTTSEGIHTGAMAGTVDLLQRCFTGIETRNDRLRLDPCLPRGLRELRLDIRYREHQLALEISNERIRITSAPGPRSPIRIAIDQDEHSLAPGDTREFRIEKRCGGDPEG